jgi:two-component system, NarL family, invasion response regulator UvrY
MAPIGQNGRENASPMPRDLVTVLTVDDQAYFRGVLRELIEATDGFRLVGEAGSGEDALEAVEALSPALVMMDKRMPGMGGVKATRLLTQAHPELVVVMTSIEDPDQAVVDACGAAAFVRKEHLSPRLLRELWRQQKSRL